MKRNYESPEMEITVFSLKTCILAQASSVIPEGTGGDDSGNQGDGDIDPFG